MSKQKDTIIRINDMIAMNGGTPDWAKIGEVIGKSAEATRSFYRRHAEKYVGDYYEEGENSIIINDDGSQTSDRLIALCEEDRKDPLRLLELHNYDPAEWILVNARDNLWHMNGGGESGGRVLLYQSKITARPKKSTELTLNDIDNWFEENRDKAPNFEIKKNKYSDDGYVLELALPDLHFGKIGIDEIDGKSTLLDDLMYTVHDIYEQVKHINLSEVIICSFGDILHYDSKSKQTTGGTGVSSDGRTAEAIFDEALSSFIHIIDLFLELAKVRYIHVSGNHDALSSYHHSKALEMYYWNNKNVEFDIAHIGRKIIKIGKTMLGLIHGNANRARLENNFLQVEGSEYWSDCKWKFVHLGHIHSFKSTTNGGVIFLNLPTLSKTDNWHSDNLYIGNTREINAFLWDKEKGLRQTFISKIV